MNRIVCCSILILAMITLLAGKSNAQDCYCVDCADCETKLADPGCSTVYLTEDIIEHHGTCIDLMADNKTFDCQGYLIDGDNMGSTGEAAVSIIGQSYIIIRNCQMNDFSENIFLVNAHYNQILNNEITDGNWAGIQLWTSTGNTIAGNYVHDG